MQVFLLLFNFLYIFFSDIRQRIGLSDPNIKKAKFHAGEAKRHVQAFLQKKINGRRFIGKLKKKIHLIGADKSSWTPAFLRKRLIPLKKPSPVNAPDLINLSSSSKTGGRIHGKKRRRRRRRTKRR